MRKKKKTKQNKETEQTLEELTELSWSVWEYLDLARVYRPNAVLTTSVMILPYRPPARLIRAKYKYKREETLS